MRSKAFGYRLGVASRALAAIVGGYAVAAVATAVLAILLPMTRADAVLTATMLSFAIYACAAIWVFAAPNAVWAWVGLAIPGVLLGVVFVVCRSGA